MHHVVGRVAGYLALAIWPTYITATIVNATRPIDERVFRGEILSMLAVFGLMFGTAWIAHVAVLLSSAEREALYKQGARDAWSVPAETVADLKSVQSHPTHRLNGTSKT